MVGASLWQIQSLDHPFAGGNPVPRAAFELAVTRFEQIDRADHRLVD
ncbi:hypothetical protein ACTD5D_34745 [Nocardia takedensis]|nr:hypothetical protein [Nocardia takedensis]